MKSVYKKGTIKVGCENKKQSETVNQKVNQWNSFPHFPPSHPTHTT